MADSEKALDSWARVTLADAFGPVAEERLPEEWLRIVEDGTWG